jgi:phage shock protein A
MMERDLERRIAAARRDQDQWRNRLSLARDWNEGELAQQAEAKLRQALEEGERCQTELDKVLAQKEKLKARVRGAAPPPASPTTPPPTRDLTPKSQTDARFRDMEVESDLDALRRRLKQELGE